MSGPRLGLLTLGAVVAWGAPPALAVGAGQAARVLVRVKTLPPPGMPPRVQEARLHVTGMGFPPRRAAGTAQGRLLARRAALVDGYRKIAHATRRCRVAAGGPDYYAAPHQAGYVRGATIEAERYFSTGRVEVDVSAPLPEEVPDPGTAAGWQGLHDAADRAGLAVVTTPVVAPDRQSISREAWEDLFDARRTGPPDDGGAR